MKYIKYITILALFSVNFTESSIKSTIFRKFNAARHGIVSLFYAAKQATQEKYVPFKTKENFNSIAGLFSAKEDLKEIIAVFNNPEKFAKSGVILPRGIVLMGDSGNGKSSIARAIAGETKNSFFMISGEIADHVSNIKELSEILTKHAPCILFVDCLDKAPMPKIAELFYALDNHDHKTAPIVILGAMNNSYSCGHNQENNNNQLFKSGRFEQEIYIDYPDLEERKEILSMYLKNISFFANTSIHHLAKITYRFSVAEIIQFISKASLLSLNKNKTSIELDDFEEAHERMISGKKQNDAFFCQEEKKIVAYHEAGHALITILTKDKYYPLHKVSIMPRDSYLGVSISFTEKEKARLRTKEDLEKRIMVCFGGHAAEEIVFGTVSNGAGSDFMQATGIIDLMIMRLGMSEKVGKIFVTSKMSEYLLKMIDQELQNFSKIYYEKTKKLLIDNRDKLDLLAAKLLEKETLYADEIYQLLGIEMPVKAVQV